ncbi:MULTISPECIES: hypothetical protein [unclassified Pseudomonas]|uniref:hypothetical protein n=1 Tax=unclassified Pseudomonas TaxID=196821 RepID=UPI000A1F3832|nr:MULTISPECIES: hypothetical protein [unclassified Pseudomonas]
MDYRLTAQGVMRLSDAAYIPQDPGNRDWLEYQAWLAAGGQVLPRLDDPDAEEPQRGVLGFFKRII